MDIARQERIEKCDLSIEAFFQFKKSQEFLRALYKGASSEVREEAKLLNNLLGDFLNKVKGDAMDCC